MREPITVTTYRVDWPNTVAVPRWRRPRREWLPRLLARARHAEVLVLNGGLSFDQLYDELLIAAAIARLRPRLNIILAECWWEPGSRRLNALAGVRSPPAVDDPQRYVLGGAVTAGLERLDSPAIHYCVCASEEREIFAARWGVPIERVHYVPYHGNDVPGPDCEAPLVDVFAGGDSLRDYRPLLAAAGQIDGHIQITTRLERPASLPPNVSYGPLASHRYRELSRRARVQVVALRRHVPRSAGQQTYLDAMLQGVPVVVTDSLGVGDYVEDGLTGWIVPPEPEPLAAAVNAALAGGEAVDSIRARARQTVLDRFTRQGFLARMRTLRTAVCDGAMAAGGPV